MINNAGDALVTSTQIILSPLFLVLSKLVNYPRPVKSFLMKVFGTAFSILLGSIVWQACGDRSAAENGVASKKGKIDFNYDVKPILSDKCFACHGPDEKKRQASFRLDTEA